MFKHFTFVACEFSQPLLFTPQKSTSIEGILLIFHCVDLLIVPVKSTQVKLISKKNIDIADSSLKIFFVWKPLVNFAFNVCVN
jgi:hypothetical protein